MDDWERDEGRTPAADRPCRLEVDLDAISANVREICSLVGPAARVCAVVKAEAYGLGAIPVARAALAGGAERLGVARVEEGVRLRTAGLDAAILLTAGFAPAEAAAIVRHRLTPTVVQMGDALALARAAGRAGVVLPVHLKVDTGLTRFGAAPSVVIDLARLLENLPSLKLEGLYTHFASADEPDQAFTREQLGRLREVHATLVAGGHHPPVLHAANSAAALAEPATRLDLVRVGLTLSGHYPSEHVPREARLHPAVSLKACLLRVYDLPPGTTIGYGRTYRAERTIRAGLVAAGYADGVPRAHSEGAFALVGDRRVPLVGRVSMDQCVVDLAEAPDARVGDEVTMFGASEGAEIGLDEFASWSGTIAHESLCRVGSRVPRLYRQAGDMYWGSTEPAAASIGTSPALDPCPSSV
jgi:alanine racemase